ncbi:MAG TPA: class I SAM-dependent methyltransferase [Pseudobdellovibrionaceae bacterium]|nr:class I SAM-dependent methyltransferase [Pseudobdellovibrionaceae bacterium]
MKTKSQNAKDRFSTRVADYVRYRPRYAPEIFELLRQEVAASAGAPRRAADIGAGTGISTEHLLQAGFAVDAIEPNAKMREALLQQLGARGESELKIVAGSAEATGLADASVGLILAAQAFHWFEPQATRKEFRRILYRPGVVAMLWNDRRTQGTEFLERYEDLLMRRGIDYAEVNHKQWDEQRLQDFLAEGGAPMRSRAWENHQVLDWDSLVGRVASSSYMPGRDDERFAPLMQELEEIFRACASSAGRVRMSYDTRVYWARWE